MPLAELTGRDAELGSGGPPKAKILPALPSTRVAAEIFAL